MDALCQTGRFRRKYPQVITSSSLQADVAFLRKPVLSVHTL